MNKRSGKAVVFAAALGALALTAACRANGTKDAASGGPDKITYWVQLNPNVSQIVSNLAETPFAKKLMEKFGCEIEYMHPARGAASEKFNLLVATGKLPDIIEYTRPTAYQGGAAKALADGIIQELDLEKDAPNLNAYIKDKPEIKKMMLTDDGKYFGYPFIRGDAYLQTSAGLFLRDDWLAELGMDLPETIDDWEAVLAAFKDKCSGAPLGNAIQYGTVQGAFVSAYGVADGLYVDNGKVKYGPMEDGYKDYLALMNKWFKAGYIDPDYATVSNSQAQANILNGVYGVGAGACGSALGRIMAAATTPGFSVTGAKYPVLNRGERAMMGNYQNAVTGTYAVITRDCKNRELCTKLLDYGYCEEGEMLFNFGIEGESYTMVDGYPTFTDEITHNSEGLSMAVAMSRYTMSHTEAPFVQDKRYMEQYAQLPQQKTALANWLDTDAKDHFMPPVTITLEQQSELVSAIDNINTYKNEMQAKFIMGIEPIENFDNFREELKKRGVEIYIQYNQEAYDRYQSR